MIYLLVIHCTRPRGLIKKISSSSWTYKLSLGHQKIMIITQLPNYVVPEQYSFKHFLKDTKSSTVTECCGISNQENKFKLYFDLDETPWPWSNARALIKCPGGVYLN